MNFFNSELNRILISGMAIGAFAYIVFLPTLSSAQNCGILGIVTCSDQGGGDNDNTAPGPGPSPEPEPEDTDDCGDCEATIE